MAGEPVACCLTRQLDVHYGFHRPVVEWLANIALHPTAACAITERTRVSAHVSRNSKSTNTNTKNSKGRGSGGSTRRCASDRPVALRGVVEFGAVGAAAGHAPVIRA